MKLAKSDSSSSSEGLKEQQDYYSTSDSSEAEVYKKKKKVQTLRRDIWGVQENKTPNFQWRNGKRRRGRILVIRDEKIFFRFIIIQIS